VEYYDAVYSNWMTVPGYPTGTTLSVDSLVVAGGGGGASEAGGGAAGTAADGLVWEKDVRARNIIEATIRLYLVIIAVIGLPQYRYKDF
jgi:hypothetical protein